MNAMTTDIDAIRQRLALVSGYTTPWTYQDDDESRTWVVGYATDNPLAGLIATVPDYGEHIADLIANAPRDLEALLAVIDHLTAKHAEVQALSMRRGEEIARLRGELNRAVRSAEEEGARSMRKRATLAADNADTASIASAEIRGLPLIPDGDDTAA